MTMISDLQRDVDRLRRQVEDQRVTIQAVDDLLRILARFALAGDREELRTALRPWLRRLRAEETPE